MIPHKNVFVMTAAFISIMLLIVARHHPPSRRKIKQIWHGRVYWESNTTMLRRPALNVSEAPSNVPSNNIKEPTASVSKSDDSSSKSDDSSSKSDASISEIQVKNSEQKQTRIPTKHADESKMHGYDKPQISEPIITKDTMPLQIKTLTTNEYVTSAKSIVMIDNRPFELWKPTLESAIKYTDDDWSIELFVSRQYEGFSQVETFLKTLAPRKYNLKHYDMHFDASKIHKSISALFETESFWNEINSENVLILQADAVMCRSGVDDYLKYDYIGSPWSHKPDGLNVGNGGASFRKRSFMLKCLKTYHKHQTDPEDVYFSNCLKDLGSVPPVDIAKDFSMEAIWSDRPMLIHKPWLQKMLTKGRSHETVWKDICAMCPDISSIPFYKGKCTKNQEQNAEHEPGLQKLTIGKYPLESAQPFLSCDVWNELNIDSVYFLRPWEDNFPSFDQMSAFLEKRPATFVMSNQLARSWPDSKDIPVLKKLLDMPNLRKMYIMNPRIFHGKIMPLPEGPKWQHKTTELYGESKIKTHKILSTVANDPKGVDQLFKKSRESIVWVRWMTDSPSNTNYEQENNALRTRRSNICAQISSTNSKVKCDLQQIPKSDYFDKLKSVRFVASPAGYGLDTHGTWEALLAGCIPIVPHSPLDPMFDDLPVWLVNDWNEVTEEAMQEKEDYFSNQNWNFEKVFFTGWKKEIQGTINKISPEGHNQYKNPKDHDRAAKTVANKCALLFFGLAKHFNDIAFPSIQKYILNINPDCDVYAHTYDIKSITNPRNNEDHTPVNPLEVYSMTKNVVLDTLESVSKAIDFDYYHKHYKQSGGVFPYSMDNTLKQWFSIQRVWESMPTTYKRVGLFRLDVLYTEPVNIQNGDAVIPDFHHWDGLNDRAFYGLYKWAGQWATNRFKKLAIRSKQDNIYDINAEHFMKYMMRDVPVELKPMCFNRVRATGKIKNDCKPRVKETSKTPTVAPSSKGTPHKKNIPKHDERQYDICVVGAGLSGAVIAERYASTLKKSVYVMEKRNHIGGNCYDYIDDETGIRINKYGAHLFHTKYERVWDYLQQFSDWTPYEHKVLAFVDGKHVPVPVNIDTVNKLFNLDIKNSDEMDEWLQNEQVHFDTPPTNSEEMSLSRVGQRLYEKMFKPYTIKQWAKTPAQLGPEVMARIPVRNNYDARYFGDKWQALPTHGYTAIFEKMFENPLITVETNVDYFKVRDTLNCGKTYYTGPVDTYFSDLGWPKLEYRSLDFVREVYDTNKYFQPISVVNHPSETVPYTRIVEYKHFLNQSSDKTVIFKEFSKDDGEPYYPVPNPENQALFQKYKDMSNKEPGVTFVGRLANYKYFNMDQTVKNALELFDKDALPSHHLHSFDSLPYNIVISGQHNGHFTGGPEALIQLALAFHSWLPNSTFFGGHRREPHTTFKNQYPLMLDIPWKSLDELKPGDIYIIPEVNSCDKNLVEFGIQMYIWQLGVWPANKNALSSKRGCQHLAHNFYLSHSNGVDIPLSQVIRPYITPSLVKSADESRGNRKDIVLIDNDTPGNIINDIERICKEINAVAIVVKGYKRSELPKLFRSAKVVVDWCMRGSERMPIEAVLNGALLLTSNCQSATDRRDYPLPPVGVVNSKTLSENLKYLIQNYATIWSEYEPIRKLYRGLNSKTMAEDTRTFIYSSQKK